MTKRRAEIGFAEAFNELQPMEWAARVSPVVVPPHAVRHVAEASGFQSREAGLETSVGAPGQPRARRVFRTGRRLQLNIKVRDSDLAAFYRICDQRQWVQGYTFQRALEALQRELAAEASSTHQVSA
jgi:hypothetical protein